MVHGQPSTLNGLLSWLQFSGGALVLFVGTTELLPAIIAGWREPASITVFVPLSDGWLALAPPPAAELLVFVTFVCADFPAADGCEALHATRPAAPSSKAHKSYTRLDMPPTWQACAVSVHPTQRLSENAHWHVGCLPFLRNL
jgi:hypothetical protein